MTNTAVTTRQVLQVQKLAQDKGLDRRAFQSALDDGTIARVLDGIKARLPIIAYAPTWIGKRLTPDLESLTIHNNRNVELWLDPRQEDGQRASEGHEIYAALKKEGLLSRSLSLFDLTWCEEHPSRIPSVFRRKKVHAWASVVENSGRELLVPYLDCFFVDRPHVSWEWVSVSFGDTSPAGLRQ